MIMFFVKLWGWIKKVCVWIYHNFWKFLVAFFGGLSVIFGASYIVQKRRSKSLLADEQFKTLKEKVNKYESLVNLLEEENETAEAEVTRLQEEKEKIKSEIEEAKDTIGLTDEEVLWEFRRIYQ